MTQPARLVQGTLGWFEMVGELMCEAANAARPPSDLNISLIERYVDGVTLPNGFGQGLRFEIENGVPQFRSGCGPEESGDVTIEITAAAARTLNLLLSSDPMFAAAQGEFVDSGEMRISGDFAPFEGLLGDVHDRIVARTA